MNNVTLIRIEYAVLPLKNPENNEKFKLQNSK